MISCVPSYFLTVTVADYANADPAVVKSGRVKKAVVNAIEKEGKTGNMYESSFSSHNNEKKILR